jgi:hypothetical protein
MNDDLSPTMRRMREAYLARRGVDLDADLGGIDPDRNPLLTEAALARVLGRRCEEWSVRVAHSIAGRARMHLDRPVLGQHRLGVGPVAVVAGPSASGIALLTTKMVCQLGAQRPLEQLCLPETRSDNTDDEVRRGSAEQ